MREGTSQRKRESYGVCGTQLHRVMLEPNVTQEHMQYEQSLIYKTCLNGADGGRNYEFING